MTELSIHEVEKLIKQLENPIRSAKSKAAVQLASANIFPSLISNSDQFLHKIISPVLMHVSDDTESVRENCLKATEKYVDDLYKEIIKEIPSNLSEIFNIVLPALFSRLKNEQIENSEHLRLYLLKTLLKFTKMITNSTIPNNFDSFIDDMIDPLLVSFKSKESDMKKIGCDFINEILLRCSQSKLEILSENISSAIFANCFHHHYEVRKRSLHSLGSLYVASGTFFIDNNETLNNSLEKLSEDRNSNVRKEVIYFCTIVLTQHEKKAKLYNSLLIPLLYFLSPIVPNRQIEVDASTIVQPKKITDESKLSLDSLNQIGSLYSVDDDDINQRIIDETNGYFANGGIVRLICDFSEELLQVILSLVVDWTQNRRIFGFSALISFIQLCGSYAARYSPHIMQTLFKSLRDNQDDSEFALQCQSILSSFLLMKEISNFLCPRITIEGPAEIIQLLIVTIINHDFNEDGNEQLELILNHCLTVKIYQEVDLIELLVKLTLAMIENSSALFVNQNSLSLSIFILKLCEKSDILKYFVNAFGKPISIVFDENLIDLLKCDLKTPIFMKILLEICSVDEIMKNQNLITDELYDLLETNESNKAIIEDIVNQLKQKNCLKEFSFTD